jgi:site-specific DNA recombinase
MALTAPPTTKHTALYLRISKDRNGRAENVETQERLAREYAERRWPGTPIEVYSDNDLSAADPGTQRPEYRRLLDDVAAGRVAHIVAADQDRLTRQVSEWEALIPVLRSAGIEGVHGYRDGFASVRPGETAASRFKSVLASEYVEGLKVKLNERLDRNAARGIPHAGRVYGYRRDVLPNGDKTLTIEPAEAEVIRWAAAEVLDGTSLNQVAQRLNDSGTPTAYSEVNGHRPAWSAGAVKSLLTSPTQAGLLAHRGEVIGPGNWEAILDPETHRLLRARLIRNRKAPRPERRRYLLSGIALCGECGGRLTGNGSADRSGGAKYRCRRHGCRRVTIAAAALERLVSEALLDRLDELVELRPVDEHAERRSEIVGELARLDERRGLIGEMLALGELDRGGYVAARAKLDSEQERLTGELAELPAPRDDIDPEGVRSGWEGLTIDERRKIIGIWIDAVWVHRSKHRARRLDLERVTIEGEGW